MPETGLSLTCNLDHIKDQISSCLSAFFQSIEVIGVSRDNTKSRQAAVKELQYRAITTKGQWPHICIFPEGALYVYFPFQIYYSVDYLGDDPGGG